MDGRKETYLLRAQCWASATLDALARTGPATECSHDASRNGLPSGLGTGKNPGREWKVVAHQATPDSINGAAAVKAEARLRQCGR